MKTLKTLILLGITIFLFTACQEKGTDSYTKNSPEIDEVKALIKDYHDGNWEAWLTHYGDTAKIYHNTWKNGTTPKETLETLKAILSNTSSYHFEEEKDLPWYEMVTNDNGNKWVYFWGNWQGTLAANNKKIEIPVHLALQFVNGKIAREEGFYNIAEFQDAVSAIQAAKVASETEVTE